MKIENFLSFNIENYLKRWKVNISRVLKVKIIYIYIYICIYGCIYVYMLNEMM